MVARVVTAPPFGDAERAAVYRAIFERRDVRADFAPGDVDPATLDRILAAANAAPSVGLSQPWRFILVRSRDTRERVRAAFESASAEAAAAYGPERAARYRALRLEGILESALNVCVVCADTARGHGLGRRTMPETLRYSAVCAVQNLWLAARAEGIGVGWVSIVDPDALRGALALPPDVAPIAYLCVGPVHAFAAGPDLERAGWETRLPLADLIDHERYGAGSQL